MVSLEVDALGPVVSFQKLIQLYDGFVVDLIALQVNLAESVVADVV